MNNFTLKLKNVCYKIGEREILKNICFKCSQGEIIGIIGPNGSGKTTLLKTINGINKMTLTILKIVCAVAIAVDIFTAGSEKFSNNFKYGLNKIVAQITPTILIRV